MKKELTLEEFVTSMTRGKNETLLRAIFSRHQVALKETLEVLGNPGKKMLLQEHVNTLVALAKSQGLEVKHQRRTDESEANSCYLKLENNHLVLYYHYDEQLTDPVHHFNTILHLWHEIIAYELLREWVRIQRPNPQDFDMEKDNQLQAQGFPQLDRAIQIYFTSPSQL